MEGAVGWGVLGTHNVLFLMLLSQVHSFCENSSSCTLVIYLMHFSVCALSFSISLFWGIPWQPSGQDSVLPLPWPRFNPWSGI